MEKLAILIKVSKSVLGNLIKSNISDGKIISNIKSLAETIAEKENDKVIAITKSSIFDKNLRNKGLGRKMYGNIAHKAKQMGYKFLTSDSDMQTSPAAENLWKSLQKRGYPVIENTFRKKNKGYHPIFGRTKYIMNLNKLKDGRV